MYLLRHSGRSASHTSPETPAVTDTGRSVSSWWKASPHVDGTDAIFAHFTVLGFSCAPRRGDLGGHWRCARGEEAFRFDVVD
jgi:hypothetical protein